jgi:PTS system cellobiose-specific IIB component
MVSNIVIVCHFGASSCLLEDRMRRAAASAGLAVNVYAVSELRPSAVTDAADVILIAPQLRYKQQEVLDVYGGMNKPILFIDPEDYGNLDGEKILNLALAEVSQGAQGAISG